MDDNTTVDSKMMETDMPLKRWVVIEVLVVERERPTSIHDRLLGVSGDATVDVSAVWWWLQWFKEGETVREAPCNKPCRVGTCIAVNLLPSRQQWTLACCTETMWSLNACLCWVHLTGKVSEVLLLHDSAWLRTSVYTTDAITDFGWKVLLHPP